MIDDERNGVHVVPVHHQRPYAGCRQDLGGMNMLEKKIRDILALYGPDLVFAENWQDQLHITCLRRVSFQQLKDLAALFPEGTEIRFEAELVWMDMYDDDLEFVGEKLGDEDAILTAIASVVEDGSFITLVMDGGEGVLSFIFNNGKVKMSVRP